MNRKPKTSTPLSLRLDADLLQRLERCADELGMGKHTLAQKAIEAAIKAVEKHDFKIVMPIEFDVTSEPGEKKPKRLYGPPSASSQASALNDAPGHKKPKAA